jgi:DedD protein
VKPAVKPEAKVDTKPEPKPAPKAETKAETKADTKADTKSVTRFVVQVGAYADETAAKDVRQRVEKLGFKTFTQDVQTPNGRRIRVRIGPFDSQADAQKALERLKGAKLPGAVLTL